MSLRARALHLAVFDEFLLHALSNAVKYAAEIVLLVSQVFCKSNCTTVFLAACRHFFFAGAN